LYVELAGMKDKDYNTKQNDLVLIEYNILWVNSLKELKRVLDEKDS